MKKIELVRELIHKNDGIIKTSDMNKIGIPNSQIKKMCERNQLKRIKNGYWTIPENENISEEKMISTFFKEGVVCMESALFYYGYSDKTPLKWTIAVPRTISKSKIKTKPNELQSKFYYYQDKTFEIGKTQVNSNNETFYMYDRERVICDCFKYKTKMDSELFNKAINYYVKDSQKNLRNLSKYAKDLKMYNKVTQLIEVMINE